MNPEFTQKFFNELLNKKQGNKIRDVLMDQNLISGIGNIYASEILFEAGILPTKHIRDLNDKDIEKIYRAIKKVLNKAIKLRGTSDSDYRDTSGAPGNFQKVLNVYRRERQKCRECGIMIKRVRMGQRSVFYCPTCQR